MTNVNSHMAITSIRIEPCVKLRCAKEILILWRSDRPILISRERTLLISKYTTRVNQEVIFLIRLETKLQLDSTFFTSR